MRLAGTAWLLAGVTCIALAACRTAESPVGSGSPSAPAPQADPAAPDGREAGAPGNPASKPPDAGDRDDRARPPRTRVPISEADLEAFGRALIKALNEGAGEAFCLTIEDINELHTPSAASIIQIGRLSWLQKIRPQIRNADLTFVEVKRGPTFNQTTTSLMSGSPFRIEVPYLSGLLVELTIDGDPAALTVEKMYLMDSGWRVFGATLTD